MPICKKCLNKFPNRVLIDGKYRILNSRLYCLECSPFGMHNTRSIHERTTKWLNTSGKLCPHCNRTFNNKGSQCKSCWATARRQRVERTIHLALGEKCWKCGYGDWTKLGMLDFHHIDPTDKSFAVNNATISCRKWSSVVEEVKKCALLCCRCHREYEHGHISLQEIISIYNTHKHLFDLLDPMMEPQPVRDPLNPYVKIRCTSIKKKVDLQMTV